MALFVTRIGRILAEIIYIYGHLFDILESDSLAGAAGPQIIVPWSRICSNFPSEMAKKTEISCKSTTFGIYHFDHVST